MIKRLIFLMAVACMLSGCFMAPIALLGPAASGFTTASIVQSSLTTGAGYLVKKSTGKTIAQHAYSALSKDILQQTYFPKTKTPKSNKKKNNRQKHPKIFQISPQNHPTNHQPKHTKIT